MIAVLLPLFGVAMPKEYVFPGGIWEETMMEFLSNPRQYFKGAIIAFSGFLGVGKRQVQGVFQEI